MADQTLNTLPKIEDKKWIKPAIWIFSVVVFLLVVIMGRLPKPDNPPAFTKALPAVNAIINFSCFLTLITSFIMVKRKQINLHLRLNTFAMLLSIFFLLSYVLYHVTNQETSYGGDMKILYYVILASHIILSATSLPFILLSYYKGITGDVAGHKKIVKLAYPVWLYVAITGPIVYLMLSPYYG